MGDRQFTVYVLLFHLVIVLMNSYCALKKQTCLCLFYTYLAEFKGAICDESLNEHATKTD